MRAGLIATGAITPAPAPAGTAHYYDVAPAREEGWSARQFGPVRDHPPALADAIAEEISINAAPWRQREIMRDGPEWLADRLGALLR